jgi:hypothetical protein
VLSNHVAREAKAIDPAVLDQVFAFAAQNIDGSPRAPGGAAPGGGPSHHGVVAGVLDALADPGVRAAVQHEMNLQAREADWLRRASWPCGPYRVIKCRTSQLSKRAKWQL